MALPAFFPPPMPMPGMPPMPMGPMGGSPMDMPGPMMGPSLDLGLPPSLMALLGLALSGADEGDDEEEKKPRSPKPDIDLVKSRADKIVAHWAPRDDRMDRDYKLYLLSKEDYPTPEEGDGQLIIRNLPYVVVEKAATLVGSQKPNIDVIAPTGDLRSEAQKLENFCRYLLKVWGDKWREGLRGDFLRDLAHYLALRGWAAIRVTYDAARQGAPIRLMPYDPRQVYPAPNSDGIEYVVHRYYTSALELVSEWPEAKKLFNGNNTRNPKGEFDPDEVVMVTAYYDDTWHAVWCDYGDVKDLTAHEYGFVPWFISLAYGSPVRATSSNQTNWVENVGQGVLFGLKDSYQQLNDILSIMATEVDKSTDPPTIYYYDPNAPEEPKKLKYGAGATNFMIYDKERVEQLHLGPQPANAGPLVDALRQDIDLAFPVSILFGQTQGTSGYALTLMTEAAEGTLWPLAQAVAWLLRQAFSKSLCLIRDFHTEAVNFYSRDPGSRKLVGGQSVDPEMIATVGCDVEVDFRQVSPRDKAMMSNLAIALTDKKLISLETARDEYLGMDNPERENDRILAEGIQMHPTAVEMLMELSLKKNEPEWYEVWKGIKAKEAQQPPTPPGMPGPQGGPGLPPEMMPPIQQAGMTDPLAGLIQSLGSAAGGMGLGGAPPGIPGIGGQLPPPPSPLSLPGMV